jgi:chemotaxis response regulator CheB
VPATPAGAVRASAGSFIAIGASTGGPQAVAECIGSIPSSVDRPILVVQHIGEEFVAGFAEWLARGTRRPVTLVGARVTPEPRVIYVAAKAKHLVAHPNGDIGLEDEPRDHLHKPSVDVLFDSLATSGATGVAVLLTGMGRDGAHGLLALRNAGWWTIAQDEATSVVWGMPGEATRIGAACETLAIGVIGPAIATGFARQAVRGNVPRGGSR